ncbi:hypothetical protein AWB99_09540 [Mycolicibacterium confluentis]|uniref:Uncharacterized protein n=1 Tax=Mycolicibacterium confluentis TaxID=28047 RepID=A0A7I7XVW5_9MYCO|nr:hypothetical protein [Mycolicibacterium confluentis]ORV31926.1 hypothetical protein AWB99_09540 [Mycolicibacterium confluentis]BBZ33440.1 hypothetical protein MCNF_20450 [Mycolicibacterium confluentis]
MSANRGSEPRTRRDLVSTLWASAAGVPPLSAGTGAAYRSLFLTARRFVLGRRITARLDRGDIAMTVTAFDSRLDVLAMARGRLDDVRLRADDITWDTCVFTHGTARLHNVRIRPGTPPVLVAAPVHLTLDIPAATLDVLFRQVSRWFVGDVGDDGVARVHLARRAGWGYLVVDARLQESGPPAVVFAPRSLVLGRRHRRIPMRLRAYRVRLPELPHGLELTQVHFEPNLLRLSGTVPEWHLEFSRRRVEVLLHQLRTARVLTLTRWL